MRILFTRITVFRSPEIYKSLRIMIDAQKTQTILLLLLIINVSNLFQKDIKKKKSSKLDLHRQKKRSETRKTWHIDFFSY